MKRIYVCIDLKSFYASVECVERGLDPLKTNLVVADRERTEKTVCLAVSPPLKKYGIGGRARLYEVISKALLFHQYHIFLMVEKDRKSTRLNSSHVSISYAVFCLKKKKKKTNTNDIRRQT